MRHPSLVRAALACAAVTAVIAYAADAFNVKPGLWEVTTTMTTGGAPLYVDGMPESGRASYAQAWAKDVGKPKTSQDRQCITAKELQQSKLFEGLATQGKSCKQTIAKQTVTAVVATSDCKDAKTTTRTAIEYVAVNPQSFNGSMKSTLTSPNGVTTMSIAINGKWVGASCPDEDEHDHDDDSGQ